MSGLALKSSLLTRVVGCLWLYNDGRALATNDTVLVLEDLQLIL